MLKHALSAAALAATLLLGFSSVHAQGAQWLESADPGTWSSVRTQSQDGEVYRASTVKDVGLGHAVGLAVNLEPGQCATVSLSMGARGMLVPSSKSLAAEPLQIELRVDSGKRWHKLFHVDTVPKPGLSATSEDLSSAERALLEDLRTGETVRVEVSVDQTAHKVRIPLAGYREALGKARSRCLAERVLAHGGAPRDPMPGAREQL